MLIKDLTDMLSAYAGKPVEKVLACALLGAAQTKLITDLHPGFFDTLVTIETAKTIVAGGYYDLTNLTTKIFMGS